MKMGWTGEATMRTFPESTFLAAGQAAGGEAPADQFGASRKKKRSAYLAWLCLGSHYRYLGRPAVQALFWLSLGGLLLWWVIDFFRLPRLVARENRRIDAETMTRLHQAAERRMRDWSKPSLVPSFTPAPEAGPAQPSPWAGMIPPQADAIGQAPRLKPRRRYLSVGPGSVLAVAGLATLAIYALTPPPLHSRALLEPSYRTLRAVNVRIAPSTSSAKRSVVQRNVVLKGRVEKVGGTRWLWITRGAHADGYVAVQNLEKL
jgi:hypothetical protein